MTVLALVAPAAIMSLGKMPARFLWPPITSRAFVPHGLQPLPTPGALHPLRGLIYFLLPIFPAPVLVSVATCTSGGRHVSTDVDKWKVEGI